MKRIGFLIENLGQSQLVCELTRAAYTLKESKIDLEVMVFTRSTATPWLKPPFATFSYAEAWGCTDMMVVATDLEGASLLRKFPNPLRSFFYLYDLEWLRLGAFDYQSVAEIYGDKRLELVLRSEAHRKPVRDAWGREAALVEHCDPLKFAELPHAT